ncbi:MAG: hypothetical protein K0S37_2375 [Microbacterium sp.]|nr:hypothetical protein [Microbacterium sp.]
MTYTDTIARVYRETVASYGPEGINRPEAIESATATLMIEVRAGRLELNIESAIRAELHKADEYDGRVADAIIERAAYGTEPLTDDDMNVIVTLGRGLRKSWRDVSPADLEQMNEIRYENYRKVRSSFEKFNQAVGRIRVVVLEHGTVGAAYAAGGFPPATANRAAA